MYSGIKVLLEATSGNYFFKTEKQNISHKQKKRKIITVNLKPPPK